MVLFELEIQALLATLQHFKTVSGTKLHVQNLQNDKSKARFKKIENESRKKLLEALSMVILFNFSYK